MNKYKFSKGLKAVSASMLFTALFASCTGNFDEINTHPYQPTEGDMSGDNFKMGAFFPQLQENVYPVQENSYQMNESLIGDVYGRYMTITNDGWKASFATFNAPAGWVNYPFEVTLTKIYGAWSTIRKETDGKGVNFAWAQILKVAAMHRMTDLYGPIPYSKVATGAINVPYDNQKVVYDNMFKDLNDAIEVLTGYVSRNPSATPMADYDEVYAGNFSKWVKFANSLKLRMALRIVYADATLAQKMAEEAINHPIGVITSNGDNTKIAYPKNPINIMWDAYSDTRVCADIVAYMDGYSDPRMEKYFQKADVNGKQGFFGLRTGISIPSKAWACKYSAPVAAPTDKVLWMNAAEVAFLRSEGAMRGWNMKGTAESLYNDGIKLSFEERGASGADAYLADTSKKPGDYVDPYGQFSQPAMSSITIKWVDGAGTEEKLERIITQKWIAMWPLGQEAWSEFRRTGYPKFMPVKVNNGVGVSSTLLARRIPFPPSEKVNNEAHYNDALTLLNGVDGYATNLWWDKKSNF